MNVAAIILMLALSVSGCDRKPHDNPYPPKIEVSYSENGKPRYLSGEYWYETKDKWIKLTNAYGNETIIISGEYVLTVKKAGR